MRYPPNGFGATDFRPARAAPPVRVRRSTIAKALVVAFAYDVVATRLSLRDVAPADDAESAVVEGDPRTTRRHPGCRPVLAHTKPARLTRNSPYSSSRVAPSQRVMLRSCVMKK